MNELINECSYHVLLQNFQIFFRIMIAHFRKETLSIVLDQNESHGQIEEDPESQNQNQEPVFADVVLDPILIFYVENPKLEYVTSCVILQLV